MKRMKSLVLASALLAPQFVQAALSDADAVVTEPGFSLPSVGTTYTEPAFGSQMKRGANADVAVGGDRMGPEYSQLQAWNSDQTLMLLGGGYIVNAETFQVLHDVDFWPSEPRGLRWSPTEPLVMYATGYHESGCPAALMRYRMTKSGNSISSKTVELVRCFSEYDRIAKDQSYEELSDDGRYIGLVGVSGGSYSIFAYDIINNIKHTPMASVKSPDWVGVSPSGRYMIALWTSGPARYEGMEAYDLNMNYLGKVHTGGGHSDIIWDADGTEWAIIDNSNNYSMFTSGKYIVKARIPDGVAYTNGNPDSAKTLAEGRTVKLLELDWFLGTHISCRNRHAPHWCVVTTEYERSDSAWKPMHNEIVRVFLDSTVASPHVERLAHHRSTMVNYWSMPFATSSPDGSRIVFTSDFHGTGGLDPYLILSAGGEVIPPREGETGGTGGGEESGGGSGGEGGSLGGGSGSGSANNESGGEQQAQSALAAMDIRWMLVSFLLIVLVRVTTTSRRLQPSSVREPNYRLK